MVEAFSARIKVAGVLMPRLSCLVVRRGINTYTFNTLVDVWRQSAEVGIRHWKLQMRGKDGTATLDMVATGLPIQASRGNLPFSCPDTLRPRRRSWSTSRRLGGAAR